MSCDVSQCPLVATFQFTRFDRRRSVKVIKTCDEHGRELLHKFRSDQAYIDTPDSPSKAGYRCVDFEMIIYHHGMEERPICVYLHESNGTRRFATMIDRCAWGSLMAQLEGTPTPRPLTHSAWVQSIEVLGGKLEYVIVDKLRDDDMWYDSRLGVATSEGIVTLSVRPSDAYTMAAATTCPIFVPESALERFADS